jgi:NarL family two-component system response regulator YdfI
MVLEAGLEVAGSAAHLDSIDEVPSESSADVIVIEDASDHVEHGRHNVSFGDLAREVAVVLLADRPEQTEFAEAFRSGIRAVLPRDISPEQLQAALRAVSAGLVVAHPSGIGVVAAIPASAASDVSPLAEPLTRREREVLQMLAGGWANKEIAARLSISDHTAKFHVASILGKLGAATRAEAVAIGIRRGLVFL